MHRHGSIEKPVMAFGLRDGLHLPTDAISNQGDASIEIVTGIRHVVLNRVEDPHHDFGMDQFGGIGCELHNRSSYQLIAAGRPNRKGPIEIIFRFPLGKRRGRGKSGSGRPKKDVVQAPDARGRGFDLENIPMRTSFVEVERSAFDECLRAFRFGTAEESLAAVMAWRDARAALIANG
jgi:hypothetical protein